MAPHNSGEPKNPSAVRLLLSVDEGSSLKAQALSELSDVVSRELQEKRIGMDECDLLLLTGAVLADDSDGVSEQLSHCQPSLLNDGFHGHRLHVLQTWVSKCRIFGEWKKEEWRGWTVLHFAVMMASMDLVSLLLSHGADSMVRDTRGLCAIDSARCWFTRAVSAVTAAASARPVSEDHSQGDEEEYFGDEDEVKDSEPRRVVVESDDSDSELFWSAETGAELASGKLDEERPPRTGALVLGYHSSVSSDESNDWIRDDWDARTRDGGIHERRRQQHQKLKEGWLRRVLADSGSAAERMDLREVLASTVRGRTGVAGRVNLLSSCQPFRLCAEAVRSEALMDDWEWLSSEESDYVTEFFVESGADDDPARALSLNTKAHYLLLSEDETEDYPATEGNTHGSSVTSGSDSSEVYIPCDHCDHCGDHGPQTLHFPEYPGDSSGKALLLRRHAEYKERKRMQRLSYCIANVYVGCLEHSSDEDDCSDDEMANRRRRLIEQFSDDIPSAAAVTAVMMDSSVDVESLNPDSLARLVAEKQLRMSEHDKRAILTALQKSMESRDEQKRRQSSQAKNLEVCSESPCQWCHSPQCESGEHLTHDPLTNDGTQQSEHCCCICLLESAAVNNAEVTDELAFIRSSAVVRIVMALSSMNVFEGSSTLARLVKFLCTLVFFGALNWLDGCTVLKMAVKVIVSVVYLAAMFGHRINDWRQCIVQNSVNAVAIASLTKANSRTDSCSAVSSSSNSSMKSVSFDHPCSSSVSAVPCPVPGSLSPSCSSSSNPCSSAVKKGLSNAGSATATSHVSSNITAMNGTSMANNNHMNDDSVNIGGGVSKKRVARRIRRLNRESETRRENVLWNDQLRGLFANGWKLYSELIENGIGEVMKKKPEWNQCELLLSRVLNFLQDYDRDCRIWLCESKRESLKIALRFAQVFDIRVLGNSHFSLMVARLFSARSQALCLMTEHTIPFHAPSHINEKYKLKVNHYRLALEDLSLATKIRVQSPIMGDFNRRYLNDQSVYLSSNVDGLSGLEAGVVEAIDAGLTPSRRKETTTVVRTVGDGSKSGDHDYAEDGLIVDQHSWDEVLSAVSSQTKDYITTAMIQERLRKCTDDSSSISSASVAITATSSNHSVNGKSGIDDCYATLLDCDQMLVGLQRCFADCLLRNGLKSDSELEGNEYQSQKKKKKQPMVDLSGLKVIPKLKRTSVLTLSSVTNGGSSSSSSSSSQCSSSKRKNGSKKSSSKRLKKKKVGSVVTGSSEFEVIYNELSKLTMIELSDLRSLLNKWLSIIRKMLNLEQWRIGAYYARIDYCSSTEIGSGGASLTSGSASVSSGVSTAHSRRSNSNTHSVRRQRGARGTQHHSSAALSSGSANAAGGACASSVSALRSAAESGRKSRRRCGGLRRRKQLSRVPLSRLCSVMLRFFLVTLVCADLLTLVLVYAFTTEHLFRCIRGAKVRLDHANKARLAASQKAAASSAASNSSSASSTTVKSGSPSSCVSSSSIPVSTHELASVVEVAFVEPPPAQPTPPIAQPVRPAPVAASTAAAAASAVNPSAVRSGDANVTSKKDKSIRDERSNSQSEAMMGSGPTKLSVKSKAGSVGSNKKKGKLNVTLTSETAMMKKHHPKSKHNGKAVHNDSKVESKETSSEKQETKENKNQDSKHESKKQMSTAVVVSSMPSNNTIIDNKVKKKGEVSKQEVTNEDVLTDPSQTTSTPDQALSKEEPGLEDALPKQLSSHSCSSVTSNSSVALSSSADCSRSRANSSYHDGYSSEEECAPALLATSTSKRAKKQKKGGKSSRTGNNNNNSVSLEEYPTDHSSGSETSVTSSVARSSCARPSNILARREKKEVSAPPVSGQGRSTSHDTSHMHHRHHSGKTGGNANGKGSSRSGKSQSHSHRGNKESRKGSMDRRSSRSDSVGSTATRSESGSVKRKKHSASPVAAVAPTVRKKTGSISGGSRNRPTKLSPLRVRSNTESAVPPPIHSASTTIHNHHHHSHSSSVYNKGAPQVRSAVMDRPRHGGGRHSSALLPSNQRGLSADYTPPPTHPPLPHKSSALAPPKYSVTSRSGSISNDSSSSSSSSTSTITATTNGSSHHYSSTRTALTAALAPNPRPDWKYNEDCQFYPHCKKGEFCPYKHPSDVGAVLPPRKRPIRMSGGLTAGMTPCKYGSSCTRSDCWYYHGESATTTAASSYHSGIGGSGGSNSHDRYLRPTVYPHPPIATPTHELFRPSAQSCSSLSNSNTRSTRHLTPMDSTSMAPSSARRAVRGPMYGPSRSAVSTNWRVKEDHHFPAAMSSHPTRIMSLDMDELLNSPLAAVKVSPPLHSYHHHSSMMDPVSVPPELPGFLHSDGFGLSRSPSPIIHGVRLPPAHMAAVDNTSVISVDSHHDDDYVPRPSQEYFGGLPSPTMSLRSEDLDTLFPPSSAGTLTSSSIGNNSTKPWICDNCSILNDPSTDFCELCSTRRSIAKLGRNAEDLSRSAMPLMSDPHSSVAAGAGVTPECPPCLRLNNDTPSSFMSSGHSHHSEGMMDEGSWLDQFEMGDSVIYRNGRSAMRATVVEIDTAKTPHTLRIRYGERPTKYLWVLPHELSKSAESSPSQRCLVPESSSDAPRESELVSSDEDDDLIMVAGSSDTFDDSDGIEDLEKHVAATAYRMVNFLMAD